MLKTAIYGMLRVGFDLLDHPLWWWGMVAMALGLATALFGVVFAAAQEDMKRLLAYSSIENIGLIVMGMGLAIVFTAYRMSSLAALALTAMLYHCLNHAIFKSLLFLGTGSVLHATAERSLGRLGGQALCGEDGNASPLRQRRATSASSRPGGQARRRASAGCSAGCPSRSSRIPSFPQSAAYHRPADWSASS